MPEEKSGGSGWDVFIKTVVERLRETGVRNVYIDSPGLRDQLLRAGLDANIYLVVRRGDLDRLPRGTAFLQVWRSSQGYAAEIYVRGCGKGWRRLGGILNPLRVKTISLVGGRLVEDTPLVTVSVEHQAVVAEHAYGRWAETLRYKGFTGTGRPGMLALPFRELARIGSLDALVYLLAENGVWVGFDVPNEEDAYRAFDKVKAALGRAGPAELVAKLTGDEAGAAARLVADEAARLGLPVDAAHPLARELERLGTRLRLGEKEYIAAAAAPNVYGDVYVKMYAVTERDISDAGWRRLNGVWVKAAAVIAGKQYSPPRGLLALDTVQGKLGAGPDELMPVFRIEPYTGEARRFAEEHGFTRLGGALVKRIYDVGDVNVFLDEARRAGLYPAIDAENYNALTGLVRAYRLVNSVKEWLESRGLPVQDVVYQEGRVEVVLKRRVPPGTFQALSGVADAATRDGVVYVLPEAVAAALSARAVQLAAGAKTMVA